MRYQVRFIEDASLPDGVEWAFVRTTRETYLFVKESAIDPASGCCDAMTAAWNAYERVAGGGSDNRLPAASNA
jgi:hypothetical protein